MGLGSATGPWESHKRPGAGASSAVPVLAPWQWCVCARVRACACLCVWFCVLFYSNRYETRHPQPMTTLQHSVLRDGSRKQTHYNKSLLWKLTTIKPSFQGNMNEKWAFRMEAGVGDWWLVLCISAQDYIGSETEDTSFWPAQMSLRLASCLGFRTPVPFRHTGMA